ncbi:MAG TPA: holo-ACP synthase [Syntrophales bacterium]|jgi:holo-[acyl-carrier protein] synthase|nr:holo-ACP synthase [Syntrophales bacterium]HRT61320.1 holo-ACP synthase [Syntrophales bacterium]
MIYGIGIDLVEIPRLERALRRWGERFEKRVFSEREIVYCRRHARPHVHYAGRFAAKEAFIKALGGSRGLAMRDIEILNDADGKPGFDLSGTVRRALEERGVLRVCLSLTHTDHQASALVVMEA